MNTNTATQTAPEEFVMGEFDANGDTTGTPHLPNGIQTIDVEAKQWFDKVNGNSYFSAQVTVNFGTPEAFTVKVPFQYGYGSQYEYEAFKALQTAGFIPEMATMSQPWKYYRDNGIIARKSKKENCKKADVKAWGE